MFTATHYTTWYLPTGTPCTTTSLHTPYQHGLFACRHLHGVILHRHTQPGLRTSTTTQRTLRKPRTRFT